MPSTFGLREFTGKTVPPNGLLTRFHMIVRPTLPGRSVAPMTATVSGRKMVSNCCRSYPRTSWAGSALLDRFIGRSFVALGLQASGFRLQFILVTRSPCLGRELAYGRRRRKFFLTPVA